MSLTSGITVCCYCCCFLLLLLLLLLLLIGEGLAEAEEEDVVEVDNTTLFSIHCRVMPR